MSGGLRFRHSERSAGKSGHLCGVLEIPPLENAFQIALLFGIFFGRNDEAF